MHDKISVNAVLGHRCAERQRSALPLIAEIFDIARCAGWQIIDGATARHHKRGQGGEVAQVPAYVFRVAPSVKMGGARHHSGCFAHLFLLTPGMRRLDAAQYRTDSHPASANLFCLSSRLGFSRDLGAQEHAAIDIQIMARHKAAVIACQKQRTTRDIDRLPQSA